MRNGCAWVGSGLSENGPEKRSSGKGTWLRVGGAVLVLLIAACLALGLFSNHAFQLRGKPVSAKKGVAPARSKPDAKSILSQLPMIFEPNQGQADSKVKFVAHGQGYSLSLDEAGAVLSLQAPRAASTGIKKQKLSSVRMKLVGANPAAELAGNNPLPGTSNYFIGNDPKQWHRGIPQFAGVQYRGVYPGIDLVFYGSQGHLEYDFKVAPGADPAQAELQFEGASKLKLSGGDLVLSESGASVRLQAPHIYQQIAEKQQTVDGRFVLHAGNRVGFEIGPYDRSRELVIDPTIVYSTYFGGTNGAESYPYVAVNGNGYIYLSGSTTSSTLPVTLDAAQSTLKGAQNIFILELSPTAGAGGVLYLTYLGGSGTDTAAGIAVDTGGNAYVAGTTTSTNFPTVNGYQSSIYAGSAGTSHVFVSKISQITSTTPSLAYSTYLSGNGTDIASGVTADTNFNVFVTGTTTSNNASSLDPAVDFPADALPVPFQPAPSSGSTIQFFVTEVNTNTIGSASIAYSTFFGGGTPTGAIAIGGGIAVDTSDNVYFSGTTNFYNSSQQTVGSPGGGTDFPILNAYQPCLDTPPPTQITYPITCTAPTTTPYPTDAFVAKLNPNNAQSGAAQLLFSTYFGGGSDDSSTGLTIDTGAANVYITGSTVSTNFVLPTAVLPFQTCLDTPVNPATGTTCPTINAPVPTDAYVAKFGNPTEATGSGSTPTSATLNYFSYLGGSGNDDGLAIAVDTGAGALITGQTNSTDFPTTTGAIQTTLGGAQNAFFTRLNTTTTSGTTSEAAYSTYFGGNGTDRGTSITVDPALNTYFVGDTTSTNLQVQAPLQSGLLGSTTQAAFAVKLQTASGLCISCIAPVVDPASTVVGAGNPITITYTVNNEGPDLATNVIITAQLSPGTAAAFGTNSSANSGTCSAPTNNVVVCTVPTLQAGSLTQVTFSVTPTKAGIGTVIASVTSANTTNTVDTEPVSFTATSFALSISPSSQTVVAGNSGTYAVLVSPTVTFGNNVALSCSSLPVGASCGFNPSTLTFNGPGAQTATLSLTTTERPPTTISSTKWRGLSYAFWIVAPGMALMGLGTDKGKRGRILGWLALVMVFAFFALQPACSKAKQVEQVTGTPAGTYPLTVTATSGTFTQSIGFNLTVQ
jgi:Beta-propeller repeat/Domain of unknown function DUF11